MKEREACSCHCKSNRMMIIVGSPRDRTISATRQWALGLNNVNHKVWFKTPRSGGTPNMNAPYIPNGNSWDRFKKPGTTRNGNSEDLSESINDCCFFEEVIIMAHGRTPGIETRIIRYLPTITGGRPIKKLILWLCNTSKSIYPNHSNNRRYFEKICGVMMPKRCGCMCDLTKCDDKCLDPDGNHPNGYRCPDITDSTTILSAAWYEHTFRNSQDINIPSKLGIDLSPTNGGQPLTSPDGRMRETTISTNAAGNTNASTQIVTNPEIFGNFSVQEDVGLKKNRPRRRDNINTDWRLRDSAPRPPRNPAPYNGPAACQTSDGCLFD